MKRGILTACVIGCCMFGSLSLAQDAATDIGALEVRAEAGDTRALTDLGRAYLYGDGVEIDTVLALSYFQQADAAGDMKAPRFLGLIALESGDTAEAAIWFAKGAENGDITSQYYLGRAYQTGEGVEQDFALAMQWYETAATRGDLIASDGMVGMASLYEAGQGVEVDLDRAIALYTQAAGLGNETAQAALDRISSQ